MAMLQIRRYTYRGIDGYHVIGRDLYGRHIAIFTTSRFKARQIVAELKRDNHQAVERILLGQP